MASNTFDKYLGIKLVSFKAGQSKIKLKLKPFMLNHGGIAHGGVLATLCDICLAFAVSTVLKKDEWCLTAQLDIRYMNPAFPKETLIGYGKVLRKGNTIAFVEGGIKTKGGKEIARAHGIWAIKSARLKGIGKARYLE